MQWCWQQAQLQNIRDRCVKGLTSNQTDVKWAAIGSSLSKMGVTGKVSTLHRASADSFRAAGVPMESNLSSHLSRNASSNCSPMAELIPVPKWAS